MSHSCKRFPGFQLPSPAFPFAPFLPSRWSRFRYKTFQDSKCRSKVRKKLRFCSKLKYIDFRGFRGIIILLSDYTASPTVIDHPKCLYKMTSNCKTPRTKVVRFFGGHLAMILVYPLPLFSVLCSGSFSHTEKIYRLLKIPKLYF